MYSHLRILPCRYFLPSPEAGHLSSQAKAEAAARPSRSPVIFRNWCMVLLSASTESVHGMNSALAFTAVKLS